MTVRTVEMKPDARIPTFEESVKQGIRKDWEASKTSQSDGNKERDKLRLELWQAAIGYKLSPCDSTMKKNLVAAVTNYIKAWGDMAGCTFARCNGDDARIDAAAAAFKTPADVRVHNALREAYEEGGITAGDFPKFIGGNAFLFTGPPFGGPQAACMPAQRTEARR
jgi:hypothetical protein